MGVFLFLIAGLGVFALFLKMIWTGSFGIPALDAAYTPRDRTRPWRIFQTVAIASFALFFIVVTWAEGTAPLEPNAATGEIVEWTYRSHVHYLTAWYHGILQGSKIFAGVMFVAFVLDSIRQARVKR